MFFCSLFYHMFLLLSVCLLLNLNHYLCRLQTEDSFGKQKILLVVLDHFLRYFFLIQPIILFQKAFTVWVYSRVYLYTFVCLFIYVVLSLFISIIMDTYEIIKNCYERGFPANRCVFPDFRTFLLTCNGSGSNLKGFPKKSLFLALNKRRYHTIIVSIRPLKGCNILFF